MSFVGFHKVKCFLVSLLYLSMSLFQCKSISDMQVLTLCYHHHRSIPFWFSFLLSFALGLSIITLF
jgi:hypothetical protein